MFGICAFLFTVTFFSSLESRAISTNLSFFTVITAGRTKQSLDISVTLSTCRVLLVVSVLVPLGPKGVLKMIVLFVVFFVPRLSGLF